jgi:hypothetical protein
LIRFSIPYYAGLALSAYGVEEGFSVSRLFDACFKSAFHQMVTGLFPLPGSAGVSELFFGSMFSDFYVETQTDHRPRHRDYPDRFREHAGRPNPLADRDLPLGGSSFPASVAALYHSRPHEDYKYANRQTYVDIQLATYDERKRSSDTLYETKQLSRKEIQKKLQNLNEWALDTDDEKSPANPPSKKEPTTKKKTDESKKKDWDSIDVH